MWTCRNCGAQNEDERTTCGQCGEKGVRPPRGAEVKRAETRRAEPDARPWIARALDAAAWGMAAVGLLGALAGAMGGAAGAIIVGILLSAGMSALLARGVSQAVADAHRARQLSEKIFEEIKK